MTVFDISTNDDWYGVILLGTSYSNPTLTLIYCIVLLYILNLMTFNLVIAIILDAFQKSVADVEERSRLSENTKHF